MKMIAVTLLLAAIGCSDFYGESDNNKTGTILSQVPTAVEDEAQGPYLANLTAINGGQVGNQSAGIAYIQITGTEMQVYITIAGAPVQVVHVQQVRNGTSCPTAANDANADGFVDVVEGKVAYGKVLINLDDDLDSFVAAETTFPMSDATGIYTYNEKASFTNFLADLQLPDDDTTDDIVKLAEGELLSLDTRQMIIHGVAPSTNLPATVASVGTLTNDVTLPIACGSIRRMTAEEEAIAKPIMDAAGPTSVTGQIGGN